MRFTQPQLVGLPRETNGICSCIVMTVVAKIKPTGLYKTITMGGGELIFPNAERKSGWGNDSRDR